MVWNKLAKKYDRLWVQKYSLAPTRKAVLKVIKDMHNRRRDDYVRQIKSIVDIGCGTGQLLSEIFSMYEKNDADKENTNAVQNAVNEENTNAVQDAIRNEDIDDTKIKLFGFDKSEEMIAYAKAKNMDASLFCADILDSTPPFLNPRDPSSDMNSQNLTSALPEGGFDLAVCCHSFPYYRSKPAAMETIADLLRSGGTAIFVQASINNPYDRAILTVIEKTAEKADYLSRKEFITLTGEKFELLSEFQIRERWFMPSICGFVLRKR